MIYSMMMKLRQGTSPNSSNYFRFGAILDSRVFVHKISSDDVLVDLHRWLHLHHFIMPNMFTYWSVAS